MDKGSARACQFNCLLLCFSGPCFKDDWVSGFADDSGLSPNIISRQILVSTGIAARCGKRLHSEPITRRQSCDWLAVGHTRAIARGRVGLWYGSFFCCLQVTVLGWKTRGSQRIFCYISKFPSAFHINANYLPNSYDPILLTETWLTKEKGHSLL